MTRDEHQNIIAFIGEAVRRDEAAQRPLDVEADAIIRALFVRNPEAAYRVTMLALAQREELARLKAELTEVKADTGKHWLSRLLGRPARQRGQRLDPSLTMLPQNFRSR